MYLKKYDLCFPNLTRKMQVTLYNCEQVYEHVCAYVCTHAPKAHAREQRENNIYSFGVRGRRSPDTSGACAAAVLLISIN